MQLEIVVRRLELADAEAGAYCHLKCWQETYVGLADPEKLAAATADVDRRIERWSTRLANGQVVWGAINPDPDAPVQEKVIGFAQSGANRDEQPPTILELYAIYVRNAWWGSGLGDQLMQEAIGNAPASLWVLEGNSRAQAFYAKYGFVPDGTRVDEPFFGVPEIRMVRSGV
ncbi:GNAT family N-acetyltransferase [Kribbella deserti]|uniref:GNAT family N-acetyltransferase n=1 Tax=Kribbella deserti TaxID=1926257 RepID=A0ABV6QQF0_9ACTN